jgi:hypothetical protein
MKKGVTIILCFVMVLVGWFANDILLDREVSAENTLKYKVVPPDFMDIRSDTERSKALEKILNDNAKAGWKLHSFSGPIIFEK